MHSIAILKFQIFHACMHILYGQLQVQNRKLNNRLIILPNISVLFLNASFNQERNPDIIECHFLKI
jgi:hypothetical protein